MLSGGFTQRTGGGDSDEEENDNEPILGWALAKLASRNNMPLLERLDPSVESARQGSLGPWPRDDDDDEDGNGDDDGASVSNASEAAFETLQREQAQDSEGVHQYTPGNTQGSSKGGSFSVGGPFPQFFVVVAGPLHLHSEPGVGGRIVAELAGGSIIKIIGKDGIMFGVL